MLSSCVDYVQSLTLHNGIYDIYCKITVSKALVALAQETGDDIDDLFGEINNFDLPSYAKTKKIDTEFEAGEEILLSIKENTHQKEKKAFLPIITKNKITVPFLLGTAPIDDTLDLTSEEGQVAAAILSSAKCRLLLDKGLAPKVETAYFAGKASKDYSLCLFDYGSCWCVEVPFIALYESEKYDFSSIIFIQG